MVSRSPRTLIDPVEHRFYSLIWQPAATMHQAWWEALALDAWRSVYQRIAYCRRWIDQAVAVRRGFPDARCSEQRSYQLNALERRLLGMAEKLPALLFALGLLRLGQPEYWLLKAYREAAQSSLDQLAYSQLIVFSATPAPAGFHLRAPLFEPAQLIDKACAYGAATLTSALPDSAGVRALEILFAPGSFDGERMPGPAASFALDMLFRLDRFF